MTGSFSLSSVEAVPASGPGALAGFESRCECGLVMRSSLRSILLFDVRDHVAFHAARGERVAEARS